MSVSRALERLLGIRTAEERHRRTLVELATAELHCVEDALKSALERTRLGRERIVSGILADESTDRIAGLEEIAASARIQTALLDKIESVEDQVANLRRDLLAKRIERRQAETLVNTARARDALEAGRKGQLELDDWYRTRKIRERRTASQAGHEPPDRMLK